MPDPTLVAIVGAVFLLAGLVKGVLGLGLPTVAIGLLGTVMRPAEAAALLVVPTLVTNLWQLFTGPAFTGLIRRLWPMMAGICLGTALGQWADLGLSGGNAGRASVALGLILVVYAVIGLARVRLHVPPGAEWWAGPLAGTVTGLISGATGVFVIPSVPYLQAIGLTRDDLVQALGLTFTVAIVALAAGLARDGEMSAAATGASLLALAPALVGVVAGGRVREAVHPETFRRWFLIGLIGLGIHLVLKGFR